MARALLYAWYEAAYAFAGLAMTVAFSLRMEGRRHIPPAGPVLLLANHQSYLDPVLVGLSAGRHVRAVARKTLFRNRLFAAFLHSLQAIPIDHEGVGKEGLRAVLDELGRGGAVLLFPEGTRTTDGRIHEFKPGIHLLLRRAPVPVVPVGIAGAYEAWPTWRPYPMPAPLFLPAGPGGTAVSVGRPLDGQRYAALPRAEALGQLSLEMQKVAARAERLRRKP